MVEKKKDKTILDFEEFEEETETNVNINDEINSNVINDSKFNLEDPLDSLLNENPNRDASTVLKGIRFDKAVSDVIDREAKKLGKGGKTQLVNKIVKNYFIQKGLM